MSSGGSSPTQADVPPVFNSIAASRYFSAATTAAGQVFTWGSGFSGELGFDGHSWVTIAREVDGVIREVSATKAQFALCVCDPIGTRGTKNVSITIWHHHVLLICRRSQITVAPGRW